MNFSTPGVCCMLGLPCAKSVLRTFSHRSYIFSLCCYASATRPISVSMWMIASIIYPASRCHYYAALLPRMGRHIASHSVCPSVCLSVRLSVCLSVRPVIVTERHVAPPSELQWHTCTFRRALRAAYRTAISAAQILVDYGEIVEAASRMTVIMSLLESHWIQCAAQQHV